MSMPAKEFFLRPTTTCLFMEVSISQRRTLSEVSKKVTNQKRKNRTTSTTLYKEIIGRHSFFSKNLFINIMLPHFIGENNNTILRIHQ